MATPIITGYNKSGRLKYAPYMQFYSSLVHDIAKCDLLLIIGYGFGDNHINNIIKLHSGKSILVNYLDLEEINEFDGSKTIDPWSSEWEEFVIPVADTLNCKFEEGDALSKEEWIISSDKRVRVWWKGIGPEFYSRWNEIIS